MHAMAEARAGSLGHKDYEKAHGFAIRSQNVYRDERGQDGHRVGDDEHEKVRDDGVIEIKYDNGYSEDWILKPRQGLNLGRIDRFEP